MPNIVAHYICGKLVAKKLNITDEDYIKGNLYPDYVDIKKHYRVPGKKFEIPDINKFLKEEKTKNKLFKLGFLSHLLLDKLYLDDFVLNEIYSKIDDNINIFESDDIYNDYTNISNSLLNNYHLNINDIDKIMLKEKDYINIEKYKNNVNIIKTSKNKNLHYLKTDTFIIFLNDASNKICDYIKINKIL